MSVSDSVQQHRYCGTYLSAVFTDWYMAGEQTKTFVILPFFYHSNLCELWMTISKNLVLKYRGMYTLFFFDIEVN